MMFNFDCWLTSYWRIFQYVCILLTIFPTCADLSHVWRSFTRVAILHTCGDLSHVCRFFIRMPTILLTCKRHLGEDGLCKLPCMCSWPVTVTHSRIFHIYNGGQQCCSTKPAAACGKRRLLSNSPTSGWRGYLIARKNFPFTLSSWERAYITFDIKRALRWV